MIFQTDTQNNISYVRFFNAAVEIGSIAIKVNDEIIVNNILHGGFSQFNKAQSGAYKLEVLITNESSSDEVVYTELLSLMPDIYYTIAITGNSENLGLFVFPLDAKNDGIRPYIRFVNLIQHDNVIDIDIDKARAVQGLMYKEVSDIISIIDKSLVIDVYDSFSDKILSDIIEVEAGVGYIAFIAGDIYSTKNPPKIYLAEDSPLL